MTIDLSRFAAKKEVMVPVAGNIFQHNRKKYRTEPVEDGWYRIEVEGNKTFLGERLYPAEDTFEKSQLALGYIFGNNILFQNFDVAKRKYRREMHAPASLNTFDSLSSVKAVAWEDGNFYVIGPNYSDTLIYQVKEALDNETSIEEIKGITPELRVLYTFTLIQKQKLAEMLRIAEEQKKRQEFLQTIPGQLAALFVRAGGKMLNCEFINFADPLNNHRSREDKRMHGRFAEVEWEVTGLRERFNTVINLDTMMIHEAGFCMSGADRKFNVTGMVQTAIDYNQTAFINITRRRGDQARDFDNDDDMDDEDW